MIERVQSSLELAFDVAQIGIARYFVRTQLGNVVPAEVARDVELIASELVTNAVEHGTPGRLPILITVTLDDHHTSITVTSSGRSAGVGPVTEWWIARPNRVTGRGLGIVKAIADEIDVSQSAESLTITARRRFTPPA